MFSIVVDRITYKAWFMEQGLDGPIRSNGLKIGGTFEITCSLRQPLARIIGITWYKDGKELLPDPEKRVKWMVMGDDLEKKWIVQLTTKNVTLDDQGTYTCKPIHAEGASIDIKFMNSYNFLLK